MMTLAWTKAAAVRGIRLTREEDAAGWPDTFQIHRLAILQSPADVKLQHVLHRALFKDCESGALQSVRTIMPFKPPIVRTMHQRGRDTREFLGGTLQVRPYDPDPREFPGRILQVRPYNPGKLSTTPAERVDHRVPPAAFSQWLNANDQPPSEHIAAWFEAQGLRSESPDAAQAPSETPQYTGAWLKARSDQLKASTRSFTQALVKETNLTEREIRRRIAAAGSAVPAQPANVKAISAAFRPKRA